MDKYSLFTLELFGNLLNENKNLINKKNIQNIKKLGFDDEYSYALFLASAYNIDVNQNKEWFYEYLLPSIKCLDTKKYKCNPYYQNVFIESKKYKNWELKWDKYKAYEAFVFDDFYLKDDKVLFNIGFFKEEFSFPAIYENDRLWMSICPNEIETMKDAINNAYGNVLVLGMGLGYYPYMISLKENVESITIIEKSKEAIEIFEKLIYPQFKNKKVNVINMDAFEYIENVDGKINYCFIDLWHDVSDGKDLYLNMKKYEEKYNNIKFDYWIEKTIKFYL